MRYLKFILINLIAFGLLFFLISLLLPSSVSVSKSVTIHSDKQLVQNEIVRFKGWNVYATDNHNVIQKSDSLIRISHPSDQFGKLSSVFVLEGTSTTNLSWGLQQKLKWYNPFEKFAAMLNEKSWIIGMDTSLNRLKVICELNPGN